MNIMTILQTVAWILVIVGGVNWGLVGALNLDLVATLFGDMTPLTRIVYGLVGLASVYLLITAMMKKCKKA
jgi:uncharacterized membrane protein YuzA (DUF378 family)